MALRRRSALWVGSALFLCAFECTSEGTDTGDTDVIVPEGQRNQYVVDTLNVPTNATEAAQLGVNVDGDLQERPDNALAGTLATLASLGMDLQPSIDAAIASGSLVVLDELQADDFTNWPNAGWTVFVGETVASPVFDGTGAFTLDPLALSPEVMPGSIFGGEFEGGPGVVRIALKLVEGAPAMQLEIVGARVEADVSASGCSGKLGGALTEEDIDQELIPAAVAMMNASIQADAGCPSSCGEHTQDLLDTFDTDANGQISAQEVRGQDIASSVLAPDVDLFDEDGTFAPRQDGVRDSLSVGFGFTCVPATW